MGTAFPPAALTRKSGEFAAGRNRIVPSGAHAASSAHELSASVCRFPPFNSTVFNLPPAKNPSERPSADQNGFAAPSVPGTAVASFAFSDRVHSLIEPFLSIAVNASFVSSGETTAGPDPNPKARKRVSRGGGTNASTGPAADTCGCANVQTARANARIANPATSDHASFSRFLPRAATGAGTPACDPPSAIHFNCSLTSCTFWKRSSGSLARHVCTTRSSAGGEAGCTVEIAGGFLSSTAAITLAVFLPSNARLPVAISYNTAPSAKISLRVSASLPSTCSGAMYWNVPSTVPRAVSGSAGAGPADVTVKLEAESPPTATFFAKPKSINFAPLLVSITLAGFKSR